MKIIDGIEYAETGVELADWLALELSSCTQFRQRGILPQRVRGRGYPIKASVQGYIEYQRSRMPKGRLPAKEEKEELSLKEQYLYEQIRAKKRENDVACGTLIDASVMIKILNDIVVAVKQRMEVIPANVKKMVPAGRTSEIVAREIGKASVYLSRLDIAAMIRETVDGEGE
jgi:phage terminase Nu1 subunit (DNA packaging protein)